MLDNISFTRLTAMIGNLWHTAKSYVTTPQLNTDQEQENNAEQNQSSGETKTHKLIGFKRLLILGTIGLFNVTRNQASLSLGLATLFVDSVNAAYPTVANPIPTQYAQPGRAWSYDIDLNQVFYDADGDVMTFGGVTMADGNPLPSWLKAEPIKLWGRDYTNDARDVEIVGDLAYVANGQYGLLIFNISNPIKKIFLGSIITSGITYGIAIENEVAYLASGLSGLQLIDISDNRYPKLLGRYDTTDTARAVVVQNKVAYVADSLSGLILINVTNPINLTWLGGFNTSGTAFDLQIVGQLAYVADGSSGLQIINISNKNQPEFLGSYDTTGRARGVQIIGQIAYVTDYSSGLQIINVTNASALKLLQNYNSAALRYAYDIKIQGQIAFISDEYSGLHLINISDSQSFIPLGVYDLLRSYGICVKNEIVYVASYDSGLVSFNVSDYNGLNLLLVPDILSGTNYIFASNNFLYLIDNARLQVVSVSITDDPQFLGEYCCMGNANTVVVLDTIAYITSGTNGLFLINISDPFNLRSCSNYFQSGQSGYTDIAIQNTIAYITADYSFQAFDISNSFQPVLLARYNATSSNPFMYSVSLFDVAACIADANYGLVFINISDSRNLRLLKSYTTMSPLDITIVNRIIYASDSGELELIDISNISNPYLIDLYNDNLNIFFPTVVVLNGTSCVIGSGQIKVINTTDPTNLLLLWKYEASFIKHLTVIRNIAYLAQGSYGLNILDLSHVHLDGMIYPNISGRYRFLVHAVNTQSQWISTDLELIIGVMNSTFSSVSDSTSFFSVNASPSSSSSGALSSTVSTNSNWFSTSSFMSQSDDLISFTISVSSTPIILEVGASNILTSNQFSITGNINPNQLVYTVQGNNPDIIITVNGIETNQFTQSDVEGNFVEIALNGITCGDYSTDLQLEANVAGSNAPAQQVSVALVLQETTCTDARKLSVFSFRYVNIGFWAKQRQSKPEEGQTYVPRLQH